MSDDESSHSSSSDESEDIQLTGLVATRARRSNAGNLLGTLLENLDDEELQKEILAEDELDDAEDYQSSGAEDDEDALDSSSDEEDAGPPQDGEPEDLTGEKELLKAERVERNRKRKAQEAKLKVPAWQNKSVKKVKLAEDAKAEDGSRSSLEPTAQLQKRKKKSERTDWRPVAEDLPTRQSARAHAVENRETILANLAENAERAKKQKKSHGDAVKKALANRWMDLTLEQRLEKCKRIEKETAKQLGRFEREEAERVRIREEALMAKRRKALEGPLIRTISTSGLYENGKLRIKRLEHGSQDVDEIVRAEAESEKQRLALERQQDEDDEVLINGAVDVPAPTASTVIDAEPTLNDQNGRKEQEDTSQINDDVVKVDLEQPDPITATNNDTAQGDSNDTSMVDVSKDDTQVAADLQTMTNVIRLEPAHAESAIQPEATTAAVEADVPASTSIKSESAELLTTNNVSILPAPVPALSTAPQASTIINHTPLLAVQPEPLLREQAQRSILILESFPSLEASTGRRNKAVSALEPTQIAQILLPESYPTFNDEEATYLKKTRKQKQEVMPKQKCALTTWEGKYRDPKTGVIYADVAAYKMLQRMVAGGCAWSDVLECWVGPSYGRMGRPAIGVPEGFDRPIEKTTQSNVKAEAV